MSNRVQALVERRVVGSPTMKAVLMYMAARSSDDGSGVWTSKSNIARDTEFSRRTVQYTITQLVDLGLLEKVGLKPCKNGETDEFVIQIDAVKDLFSTRATDAPVQELHATCATDAHHGVQELHTNSPLITLKSSLTPKPQKFRQADFDNFWAVYPKRVSKAGAIRKFKASLQIATAEQIINGAKRYAASKQVKEGFVKDPTTWLHNGCWDDEVESATTGKASRYKAIAEGRA